MSEFDGTSCKGRGADGEGPVSAGTGVLGDLLNNLKKSVLKKSTPAEVRYRLPSGDAAGRRTSKAGLPGTAAAKSVWPIGVD